MSADGWQLALDPEANTVTVTITNGDTTRTYELTIYRGASPTVWHSVQDFTTLAAAGNEAPTGLWADADTMWVADVEDDKIYAYNRATKARDADEDFDTLAAAGNMEALGLWSDGTTMWVVDAWKDKVFAYNMTTKARDADKEFDLAEAGNNSPWGIWADDSTFWVSDIGDDKLYAYRRSDRTHDPDNDLAMSSMNMEPLGLWSDEATLFVADAWKDKLFAYDAETGRHLPAFDFTTLAAAGNQDPRGVWADGANIWVADRKDSRVYAYSLGGLSATTLSALTLSDLDLDFHPGVTVYNVPLPSGVTVTTVAAVPAEDGATLAFDPVTDADLTTEGHQVTLPAEGRVITVTVTSADGARQRVYTVRIAQSPLVSFTLVDGRTDLKALAADTIVNLSDHPSTTAFGIRANLAVGEAIGSVRMTLEGPQRRAHTENHLPYSLYGDNPDGALDGGPLPVGAYQLSATPYPQPRLGGTALPALSVAFTVTDRTLSALALSGVDIGSFDSDTLAYTASVAHATAQTTVTATPVDSTATVTLDPADADMTTEGHQISLAEGSNTITLTVTATDETTQTYTVEIERAAASSQQPCTIRRLGPIQAIRRLGPDHANCREREPECPGVEWGGHREL